MSIGPGEDFLAAQPGQRLAVAHAPMRGQQTRQGGTPSQAARADAQGLIHVQPGVAGRAADQAGFPGGPAPCAAEISIGPTEMSWTVSFGSALRLRVPRCSARRRARDDPPGRPRQPLCRPTSTPIHFSPRVPGIAPDFAVGHLPKRRKWLSAQARIFWIDSSGRAAGLRTPRGGRSAEHCPLSASSLPTSRGCARTRGRARGRSVHASRQPRRESGQWQARPRGMPAGVVFFCA
jgi:hypothetical protein